MMTLFGLETALILLTRKLRIKNYPESGFLFACIQESCEAALQAQGHCYGCPITDGATIEAWEAVVTPLNLGVTILGLVGNFLSVWVLARTASSR